MKEKEIKGRQRKREGKRERDERERGYRRRIKESETAWREREDIEEK